MLRIADTGPGIEERIARTSSTGSTPGAARSLPGSDLGLAIVAQTAAQHGGTVSVAPNAPHGTVITIELPAVEAAFSRNS